MVRKALVFLALCALAQTTFATAETTRSKTTVMYPSAYGVSQPLSELPIEQSIFGEQAMPEPGPGPLRSKASGLSPQPDPALQTEVGPMVSATNGILFDGSRQRAIRGLQQERSGAGRTDQHSELIYAAGWRLRIGNVWRPRGAL